MSERLTLSCGCEVSASHDWVDGITGIEVDHQCNCAERIAALRAKIERIYEIFDVPLEDDEASAINMVEYWRNLWASWQGWLESQNIHNPF